MGLRGKLPAGKLAWQDMRVMFCGWCGRHRYSLIWIAGLMLGVGVGSLVRLPFSDALGVVGKLTLIRYNPANNIVRFLFAVFMPVALLLLAGMWRKVTAPAAVCRCLDPDSGRGGAQARVSVSGKFALLFGGAVLVLAVSLNLPTYHAWGEFDTFHEGESLGTSVSVEAGKIPYKDVIFAHGIFQDPYRSILASRLLTRSIGAARTVESALKVCACLALFVLLCILLDWNPVGVCSAFVLLALMVRLKLLLIMPRDLPTFIYLASLVHALRHYRESDSLLLPFNVFLASAMASLAFVYSIDRGFYLSAVLLVMLPLLVAASASLKNGLVLVAAACAGISVGVATLAYLMHGQLQAFADFVLVMMPKYKELMDGAVYQPGRRMNVICLAAVSWPIYAMLGDFMTTGSHGRKLPARLWVYCRSHLEYIALILLSLCFLRSDLGRADREHLIYSVAPLFILYIRLFRSFFIAPDGRLQRVGAGRA